MEFERTTSSRVRPGLTSLIDMVFLLLIFFMLTTSFSSNYGLALHFASAGDADAVRAQGTLMLRAEGGGSIAVEGETVGFDAMRRIVRERITAAPQTAVLLSAAPHATVQDLVSALDQAHLAGAEHVTLVETKERTR